MAIITNYICDKCNDSQVTPQQFWTLGLHLNHNFSNPYKTINLCRNCLESFGIHATDETKKSPDYNPPKTVEDLFREIIEIVNQ